MKNHPNCPRTVANSGVRRGVLRAAAVALLTGAPAFVLLPVFFTHSAQAQNAAKSVQGQVFSANEKPLPGAIVYIQNNSTNVIKTFITTASGNYRFGQLPADVDYKIWARYKNEESKSRILSSFDSKLNVTIDFHIGK